MHTLDLSSTPDQDVVHLASQGDEAAQRELVRRFEPVVFSLVLRIVRRTDAAEDLTQEIFLKVFDALEDRGPTRNAAGWIRTVARNATFDYVNRKRLDASYRLTNVTPTGIQLPDTGDAPAPDGDVHEFAAALEGAVGHLRPEYRRCVELWLFEEMSYREIAKRLRLPEGTVAGYLSRARAELRDMLDPWLDTSRDDPTATPA
jgi:RNA polymerase sigma-70 factor (ECF subfamily)